METRWKRKAIGCPLFLQVALLIAALLLPTSSGIDCYCSNTPSHLFPLCHWDGYTCSGDVCYVRKVLEDDGIVYTKWGCLREGEHHIDLICDDGAFNTDVEQYRCCTDSTNCNEHIEVVLPIHLPPSTTAAAVTTVEDPSSGSGGGGLVDPQPSTDPRSTTTAAVTSLPVPSPSTVASNTRLPPGASISPSSSQPVLPPSPPVSSLPLLPTSTPPPITPGPQLLCSCSDCDSGSVACSAGGSCYVRVNSDLQQRQDNRLNPQSLSLGCMNATESVKKCEGSPEQYKCCASGDFCNKELLASMTEQPTATSSNGCVSGDCQPLDKPKIITIAVVAAVTLTILLTILILVALVLARIRNVRGKGIPVSTEGSSRSDSRVNSVSTELDSVNGGSPTSKISPHHLLNVQVIPHVCEKEHVFGDSDNGST